MKYVVALIFCLSCSGCGTSAGAPASNQKTDDGQLISPKAPDLGDPAQIEPALQDLVPVPTPAPTPVATPVELPSPTPTPVIAPTPTPEPSKYMQCLLDTTPVPMTNPVNGGTYYNAGPRVLCTGGKLGSAIVQWAPWKSLPSYGLSMVNVENGLLYAECIDRFAIPNSLEATRSCANHTGPALVCVSYRYIEVLPSGNKTYAYRADCGGALDVNAGFIPY